MRKSILALVCMLLTTAAVAQSTRVVRGFAYKDDGSPLVGVTIKAVGEDVAAHSVQGGIFELKVSPYAKYVEASYEGYISAQAEIDGSVIIFRLKVDKKYAEAQAKAEAERLAAEKAAAEKAEAERVAAEKAAAAKAEAERKAEEQARIAAQKAAEAEAKAAAERKAAEERAEAERKAAEEKARIAEEKRLAAEKAKAEKEEQARLAAEAKAEAERKAAEEKARIEAEKARIAEEKARLAEEKRLATEKAAAEKEAAERAEAEFAKQARLEQERLKEAEKLALQEEKRAKEEALLQKKRAQAEARDEKAKVWKEASVKGYRSLVEFSFMMDTELMPSYNLHYIGGYQINNLFYVGLGVGASLHGSAFGEAPRWSKEPQDYALSLGYVNIPVFAYFRANFINRRCSPFFALAAGYKFGPKHDFAMPWQNTNEKYSTSGLLVNPQLGVNFRMTKKADIYLAAGFNLQQLPMFDASQSTMFDAKFYKKFAYGFDIRLGFTF